MSERQTKRTAAGNQVCSHDTTDDMPEFSTNATTSTDGLCIRCLSEAMQVPLDTARTIAARIKDPCLCGIPDDEICWHCILDNPDEACDPPCPQAQVHSSHCPIHKFGTLTPDEFAALPDWPGRARTNQQPSEPNN